LSQTSSSRLRGDPGSNGSLREPSAFDIALNAVDLGFSPVPPREDGSKRPQSTWKRYQTTPATRQEVRAWFKGNRSGIGLVTGYNGLECFEFDCPETYQRYLAAAAAVDLGGLVAKVRAGYEEKTPGGGYHWLYCCDELRGNEKLAMRPKTPEELNDKDRDEIRAAEARGKVHVPLRTLLETRGEGGFVVIAPSSGKVHPSGGAYELLSGGLDSVATLTAEEREALWDLAGTFDEVPESAPVGQPPARAASTTARDRPEFPDAGVSPGDDFEERADWDGDVLGPFGWAAVHASGGTTYWRRPGKDVGWSATTGRCKGLKVFTSSTPFDTKGTHTKFKAYTLLNHGEDWSAAVKALVQAGYGTWIDNDGTERQNPPPKDWRRSKPGAVEPPGDGKPDATPADGPKTYPYANFKARIVREIVRHEGAETSRHVDVEATHRDRTVATVTVAAKDFEGMAWVPTQLGLKFLINSGRNAKEQLQHAIRDESFGKELVTRHIYTSLGWEVIGDKPVYLHAGGIVGDCGAWDVEVDLPPELAAYRLPDPDPGRFAEAVRRVLAIRDRLGIAAERAAAITQAMPFRAVLGPSRLVPHYAGTTGTLKTSLACLAVRHFAPTLEYSDAMPLSWGSTVAGLERIRNLARDSLVVIDDLIADGDEARKDLAKADTVINSQGNLAGKARMRADGSSAPRLDPRGSIISTGECEPRRKSSTGRSMIVEFRPGMIDLAGLKRCHDDARDGWYAQAMASYVAHLAGGRLSDQRAELKALARRYLARAAEACPDCHPRHAEAVAEWAAAWRLFLDFAADKHAITREEADEHAERTTAALIASLATQAEIQEESDPAQAYVELLQSLLAAKRVVLAGMDGLAPDPAIAAACGWERKEQAVGTSAVLVWDLAPGATRVGWIDDDYAYLDPNASHAAVERMGRELGRLIGSQRQVQARLAESKLCRVETQAAGERRRFTVRARAEGVRRRCICLDRSKLIDDGETAADTGRAPISVGGDRDPAPY
jgi:hypothetical protein